MSEGLSHMVAGLEFKVEEFCREAVSNYELIGLMSLAAFNKAPRSRSATTTPSGSRSVTTTLVRSRTVTNDLPGYDSGSICT
ncbi:hypothetical protein WN943_001093 [Citrus x changshan-huyou]